MSAAMQLKASLSADDQRLLADSIEGETEAFEVMDRVVEAVLGNEMLIEIGKLRLRRIEARVDKLRSLVARMLAALELDEPLERPLYTAALSHTRHVIVTDATKLPAAMLRTAPDTRLIGSLLRTGQRVEGAELSNPEPGLTLRTR